MSEKYKFRNPEGLYFVTSTVVFWIDLFTRKEYKHVLINCLKYYQQKRGLIIPTGSRKITYNYRNPGAARTLLETNLSHRYRKKVQSTKIAGNASLGHVQPLA